MDSTTTERIAKLGTIFQDAAEHFSALGKLFGQMVELSPLPSVGSPAINSPAGSGRKQKKFIADRYWSTDELQKLEDGLKLFGNDAAKIKAHINTSRSTKDVERMAGYYIKGQVIDVSKKRKRDDSPAKENNKRQKTAEADLPSVKSSQDKSKSTASPKKKESTPVKPKPKETPKKKPESVSSSESSDEDDAKKHSAAKHKSQSSEEESSSEESASFD